MKASFASGTLTSGMIVSPKVFYGVNRLYEVNICRTDIYLITKILRLFQKGLFIAAVSIVLCFVKSLSGLRGRSGRKRQVTAWPSLPFLLPLKGKQVINQKRKEKKNFLCKRILWVNGEREE